MQWYFIVVSTCISLMVNDIDYLFMCLFVIYRSFLVNVCSCLLPILWMDYVYYWVMRIISKSLSPVLGMSLHSILINGRGWPISESLLKGNFRLPIVEILRKIPIGWVQSFRDKALGSPKKEYLLKLWPQSCFTIGQWIVKPNDKGIKGWRIFEETLIFLTPQVPFHVQEPQATTSDHISWLIPLQRRSKLVNWHALEEKPSLAQPSLMPLCAIIHFVLHLKEANHMSQKGRITVAHCYLCLGNITLLLLWFLWNITFCYWYGFYFMK